MNTLRLPWWFNLVESGIPYLLASTFSIVLMLTLGGWLGMPESIQLLKWVEALFMAMSPAVKFLAVISMGLGSFLSTFAIVSVFVCGLLYNYVKKPALEGLEVSEELLSQTKELQDSILKQGELNELFKQQVEFLKGYAQALKAKIDNPDEIKPQAQKNRLNSMFDGEWLQTELSHQDEERQEEEQEEVETPHSETDERTGNFGEQEFLPHIETPENNFSERQERHSPETPLQQSQPVIFSTQQLSTQRPHSQKQKSSRLSILNKHNRRQGHHVSRNGHHNKKAFR